MQWLSYLRPLLLVSLVLGTIVADLLLSPTPRPPASTSVHFLEVYATRPGATAREARDPAVRNGYFTGSFLQHVATQGARVGARQLLPLVRDAVYTMSSGMQLPEVRDSLLQDVFLVPGGGGGSGGGGP